MASCTRNVSYKTFVAKASTEFRVKPTSIYQTKDNLAMQLVIPVQQNLFQDMLLVKFALQHASTQSTNNSLSQQNKIQARSSLWSKRKKLSNPKDHRKLVGSKQKGCAHL